MHAEDRNPADHLRTRHKPITSEFVFPLIAAYFRCHFAGPIELSHLDEDRHA